MKILFLTHYYPPEGNAPASRVSALAERWVKAGHSVTVLTCFPNVPNGIVYDGYRNRWKQVETVNGVTVVRVWTYIAPNKGTLKRMLNFASYMVRAFACGLLMKRPDVMIATSPQFLCGWAGVLLHWFRRFPFVLEIRDIWPESIVTVGAKMPFGTLRVLVAMERRMYKAADHIVTVGEGYSQRLIEKGVPRDKMDVVMNGVDTEFFYPRGKNEALLREYGLEDKFVCSYIGTIGMACGLHVVLDAAADLKARGRDDIRFVLVGDGAARSELEDRAKAEGLSNVVFTGRRPKSEMPDWIASSDVNLVHLKKSDLFTTVLPSKIFESAGCSCPMIIGVDGFARKLVLDAEAGLYMAPESKADLIAAVEKMASDPDLCERLGRNAHANIASRYTRDRQAVDYLSILSMALGKD